MYTLNELEQKALSAKELCKRKVASLAILRVHIASRLMNKITRSSRVTFTGQLADLGKKKTRDLRYILYKSSNNNFNFFLAGGVVGLFTGMSILSLFEILFWAVRIIRSFRI